MMRKDRRNKQKNKQTNKKWDYEVVPGRPLFIMIQGILRHFHQTHGLSHIFFLNLFG